MRLRAGSFFVAAACAALTAAAWPAVTLPDGRTITPAGFTIPLEGFASAQALSPDGRWLAVLAQDGGAVDVLSLDRSMLVDRLAVSAANALTWTTDGLYVTRGYSGTVARFAYDGSAKRPAFTKRVDMQVDANGLLGGVAEDPATHRLAVTRTAAREVVVLDDESGRVLARHAAPGQPFGVGFAGATLLATLYDGDAVAAWRSDTGDAIAVGTGPHPTQLLIDGPTAYVANADGHDVAAVDVASLRVVRRYDLGIGAGRPPGQTPAGMALSDDRSTLYVAESGFNDVAVVDVRTGTVRGRIPTAWYPTAVTFVGRATVEKKDPRVRAQLWVASAKGMGTQPDPGGEWDGISTGLETHLVVEPGRLAAWTAQVARNDRFESPQPARGALPPIKHVVFIVRENKHFDEEFGDEPAAASDPALLLYGRRYTPNMHQLAETYAMFDDFMTDGEASIYGHAWTTQGMTNDYHERNAHARDESTSGIDARVPFSIWPAPVAGEDTLSPADMDFDWFRDLSDLPRGPRVNVSGVFGPRGELVDELQRKGVPYRVYGEQLTMRPDGRIAPGLAAHADRTYPGAHIDFAVRDTERARLFLDDVRAHGLPAYAYLTLPTDHTAGAKAGFATPASYVADNDVALGRIVAGLSQRADWRDTIVVVTCDDAQGTGDHLDSHRMPAFAVGPYVRRGFIDHTHYSQTSILRTVELLFGLEPLSIYDAAATPIVAAFARQPAVARYTARPSAIPFERNPGTAAALTLPIDGPDAGAIAEAEWSALRGAASLPAHRRYLAALADDAER